MRVHFLGGADEVGASSLLVEAGGKRILIDAGIRMGKAQGDKLPDLSRATTLGGLDAVLLTHAHLDHSGALPLVHGAFPGAEVLCTEPTAAILRVLLLDAVKIMEKNAGTEDEIPLYPLPAVEALLGRITTARFLDPIPLCGGAITATFFPAGHVLGAAAIGLQTAEGNLLVTGDVSVSPQRTVVGMSVPRFKPDLVVCESTYGNRLHASRRAEEERLVETVFTALRAGQKVLVPAFALGRAQEVILVLRRALSRPDAPKVAVWVDGMVRSICDLYERFSPYLSPALRFRAEQDKHLFYTADGRIRPVADPEMRKAILAGPACVVISSSGMLSGGPSSLYAAALALSPDALIALTGYQDEESPGRRLQELAAGQTKDLALSGTRITAQCRVETYALSAHADAQQLTGLVQALRPGQVALVHGDGEARLALARLMGQTGVETILPRAGDVLEVGVPRKAHASMADRRPARTIGAGRPLDVDALKELHGHLWKEWGEIRAFSVSEMLGIWQGSSAPTREELDGLHRLLEEHPDWFRPDPRRPFCFRPVDPAQAPAPALEPGRDEQGRLEQNVSLAEVRRILGDDPTLYRQGAERESWTLRLFFHFPNVARSRHQSRFEELAVRTGWKVEVHPEVHLGALEQKVRDLLGPENPPTKAPSVNRESRSVKVQISSLPEPALLKSLRERMQAETGFRLEVEESKTGTPAAKRIFDKAGQMEINLAFQQVDQAFRDAPQGPYKKSKKSDSEGVYIELSFISPEVGRRHEDRIRELEQITCWRIRIAERIDQNAILNLVRELLPRDWVMAKPPGLDVANRKVMLRLSSPVPSKALERYAQEILQRTGFILTVQ